MAAEGILYDLKQGFFSGKDAEIQAFLSPAVEKSDALDLDELASYGQYAVRFLHAYTTQFDKIAVSDLPDVLTTVLQCCRCTSVCKATGPEPLTSEKLTMHILIKSLKKNLENAQNKTKNSREVVALITSKKYMGFLEESIKLAHLLCTELQKTSSDHKKSAQNIAHAAFVSLWNTALQREQVDKNLDISVCLKLRHCAVMLLLLSGKGMDTVLDKVRVTVDTFDHKMANISKHGKQPKDMKKELDSAQELINYFVDQLTQNGFGEDESSSTAGLLGCVELQMKQIKLLLSRGRYEDCVSAVNALQALLNSKACSLNGKDVPGLDVYHLCCNFLLLGTQIFQNMKNIGKSKKVVVPWDNIFTGISKCGTTFSSMQFSKVKRSAIWPSVARLLSSCSIFCFQQFGDEITRTRTASVLLTLPPNIQDAVLKFHDIMAAILHLEIAVILSRQKDQKDQEVVICTLKRLKYVRGEEIRVMSNKLYALHSKLLTCKGASDDKMKDLAERCLADLKKLLNIISVGTSAKICPLDNEEHLHLGNVAFRLGRVCFNMLAYSVSIPFLEISCSQAKLWAEKNPSGDISLKGGALWRKHEALADAQRRNSQYREACDTIVSGLLSDQGQLSTAADLWIKIKVEATKKDSSSNLTSRFLIDCLAHHNPNIPSHEILEAELKASRNNRVPMLDVQFTLVERLLDLDLPAFNRSCHLVRKAQLMWATRRERDSPIQDMCQEAVQQLEMLASSKNRAVATSCVRDQLAVALVWNYILQDVDPLQLRSNFGKKPNDDSRPSSPTADLKQAETHGEITTVSQEQETLAGLRKALGLWEGLLEEEADGKLLSNLQETMDQVAILVSIFKLQQKHHLLLRSLRLVVKLAKIIKNVDNYLRGQAQLMQLYCSVRQPVLANNVAIETETFILSCKGDTTRKTAAYVYFLLAKAEANLLLNKVMEGAGFLQEAVETKSSHIRDKSKEGLVLESSMRQLQSRFEALPSAYTYGQAAIDSRELGMAGADEPIDLQSPLDLQVRGVRCISGVMCCMVGAWLVTTGNEKETPKVPDNAIDRWDILERQLSSLEITGQYFLDIGEAREAALYLQQGLRLAKGFNLPTRCATFELTLSRLYTRQHKFDTCQANLNTIHYILYTGNKPDHKGSPADQANGTKKPKKSVSFGFSDSEEEVGIHFSDPDFIKTKPLNVSNDDDSLNHGSTNHECNSPSLQKKLPRPPDFWSHDLDCTCEKCMDLSLSSLHLNYFSQQAQCLSSQGKILEAESFWHFFLQNFDKITMKAQHNFKQLLEMFPETKPTKDPSSPSTLNPSFFQSSLVDVCLELTEFSVDQSNPGLFEEWSTKAGELLDLNKFPWMVESRNDLVRLEVLQSIGSIPWPDSNVQNLDTNVDQLCKQIGRIRLADQPPLETPANPIRKKGSKNKALVRKKRASKGAAKDDPTEEKSVITADEDTIVSSQKQRSKHTAFCEIGVKKFPSVDKGDVKKVSENSGDESGEETSTVKSTVKKGKAYSTNKSSSKVVRKSVDLIQENPKPTQPIPSIVITNGDKNLDSTEQIAVKAAYKTPARKMRIKGKSSVAEDPLVKSVVTMDFKTPRTASKILQGNTGGEFKKAFRTPCSVSSRRAALDILMDSDSEDEKSKSVKKSVSRKSKTTGRLLQPPGKSGIKNKKDSIREESPLKDLNRESKSLTERKPVKSPVFTLLKNSFGRSAALQQENRENVFDFVCSEDEGGLTPKPKGKSRAAIGKSKKTTSKKVASSVPRLSKKECMGLEKTGITGGNSKANGTTKKKSSSGKVTEADASERVTLSTKGKRTRVTRGSVEESRAEEYTTSYALELPQEDSLYLPDDEYSDVDGSIHIHGRDDRIPTPKVMPFKRPGGQRICTPYPGKNYNIFHASSPMDQCHIYVEQYDGLTDLSWNYQSDSEHSPLVVFEDEIRDSCTPRLGLNSLLCDISRIETPRHLRMDSMSSFGSVSSLGASQMVTSLNFSVIHNDTSPVPEGKLSIPQIERSCNVQVEMTRIQTSMKRSREKVVTFDDIETKRGDSGSEEDDIGSRQHNRNHQNRGNKCEQPCKKLRTGHEIDDPEMPRMSKPKGAAAKEENCVKKSINIRPPHKSSNSSSSIGQSDSTCNAVIAHLEQNFRLVSHYPPVPTYRCLCHNLAVLHLHNGNTWQTAFYLNEAMAITFRHNALANIGKKLRKLERDDGSGVDGLAQDLQALDIKPSFREQQLQMKQQLAFGKNVDYFRQLCHLLPEGMTICQFSVVSPSSHSPGHMVATRYCQGQDPVVLLLPGFSNGRGQRIIAEFGIIMSESKDTLTLKDKVAWWHQRQTLDEQLKDLLRDMEDQWLGSWRGIIAGRPCSTRDQDCLASATSSALLELQALTPDGASLNPQMVELLVSSVHLLSEREMIEGVSGLLRRATASEDLTANPDDIVKMVDILKKFNKSLDQATCSRQPVVLILDKGLQHLPWESLPILRDHTVTRMPSLTFLCAHHSLLVESNAGSILQTGVNPSNAFYILNPDNNLPWTQETFKEWFESNSHWKGMTARVPTSTEYTNALRTHDLFIYCGHGNGAKYLCGEMLATGWCRAAVLLIGCSSGLLKNDGCLEAAGMMLNYLLAGCPCVVGNLWDVTDRDIDRYLESVLKKWLSKKEDPSLLHHIHSSRNQCRLTYLVGAAPIVYGLPVMLDSKK